MSRDISNSDDVLDSRDVIKKIEDLEAELDDCEDRGKHAEAEKCEKCPQSSECAELKALRALAEEGEGSPDWNHGETLIRESHFKDYAEQFADDIGAIDARANWPLNCIDWDKAAEELKSDYMEVDYDGVTYLIRA